VSSGTWVNSGDLNVGFDGTGALNVSGGSVTNSFGYLGYYASSVGTATVSSGTWANSGNLTVGVSGTGTLNLNGGLVTVGGTLSQGGAGTINLNSGGMLQIGVGGTTGVLSVPTLANNGTLIFNRSDASTYSGSISGTGAVTKAGNGTLTLSANNGYTGRTQVNGGTLALNNTNALAGTGTISFGGGSLQYSASNTRDYSAKILYSGSAIAIDTNGQNVTFATGLGSSNTGGLTKTGLGTLTLTASNGYTGGTTISSGTLQVGNGGTTGSIDGNVVNNAMLMFNRSDALTYSGEISGSGGLRNLGSTTLTLSGSNGYTGVTNIATGFLVLNNTNALAGTGTISFTGGGTLRYSASNTVDYSAKILSNGIQIKIDTNGQNVTFASGLAASNTGGLRKSGGGTLTLSASNGYTGDTVVSGGTLALNNTNALAGSGTISFGGGTLQYSASNTVDYSAKILNSSVISIDTNSQSVTFATGLAASNRGLMKEGLGTLTLSASNGFTGRTQVNGGTLALNNTSALAGSGTLSFGGGSLQYSASNTVDYSSKILSSGSAISIDTNGQNATFATGLAASNTGGLTKLGNGTLTLSGSSSYTGATAVNGGKLLVNGQLDNTAVAVNASGLISGSGTILGGVTVASSGTLSPGNSPGVLTVGSLSLLAGSHTLMEITGTSAGLYDQIVGTGALTYGGNLDLVMSGSYADGTTFNLFRNFSTKTLDFAAVGLNATGEYAGLTFSDSNHVGGVWTSTWTTNHQRLVFSTGTGDLVVVPEPSTVAMALAGLTFGGWRMMRRRRLRQATSLAA